MHCTTIKEGMECPLCLLKGVLTTTGFAIRSSSSARVAIAVLSSHPAGFAQPALNQLRNGKMVIATWRLMSVQRPRLQRPRSIRSRPLKEGADKFACDPMVNLAHDPGGVFFVNNFSMLTNWMQIPTSCIAERISSKGGKDGAIRMFRSRGSFMYG